MTNKSEPLLTVTDLKTHFFTEEGVVKAVDGVSFHVNEGEVLGLVGESGCGKSVTSLSIMRLISPPGKIISGEVVFDGVPLHDNTETQMAQIRGRDVAMIFQQPQNSLNPVHTTGNQVAEVYTLHSDISKSDAQDKAVDMFQMVGIPDSEQKIHAYPHEMSGGQAQRVMIAMGLSQSPKLLIADEPTTALDVTIQAQILNLMRDLKEKLNTAVILITHDLGVVAEMADRVAVMYAGQIVEQAETETLFKKPLHPYTQGLIASIPIMGQLKERLSVIPGTVPNLVNAPKGCLFAPRCQARIEHNLTQCTEETPEVTMVQEGHLLRCWLYDTDTVSISSEGLEELISVEDEKAISPKEPSDDLVQVKNLIKYFPVHGGILKRVVAQVRAVDDVSFTIKKGETLSLVGESGCGKTTVGRTILRLYEPDSGTAWFNGRDIFDMNKKEIKNLRRDMQIVLQDPFGSLNPRKTVGKSIIDGLNIHHIGTKKERQDIVIETLRKVGLEDYHALRFPHEFSGGQRQRIGIARALALQPQFIVCDEPVSALDVSVQSQVLNLLNDLQDEFGLTYLFIAHNLSVVEHISDRVAVMYLGRIVEMAPRDDLFNNPLHPYTQALMSAVPVPDPTTKKKERMLLSGDVPSPLNPPSGCHFHTRCPFVKDRCRVESPPLAVKTNEHYVSCWLMEEE